MRASRKRAERLMREQKLRAGQRRGYAKTAGSGHGLAAAQSRHPREGLIFHSGRGVQYCGGEFRVLLKRLCPAARQGMGRKGGCRDNACAGGFFKALKAELGIFDGDYNFKEAQEGVFEYIEVLLQQTP
jgi:transposase InsO family protein